MNTTDMKKLAVNRVKQLEEITRPMNQLLILTHGNPDPDSIASAFALKYILNPLANCRVRVAYPGIIGRTENQTMVKELNLLMVKMKEIKWRCYDGIALVDHQPRRRMYPWPDNRWPDIVIDHHPRRRFEKPVSFIDVRTEFGSNSGLLASYLLALDIEIPRWLATALAYGIRSDTQEFSRGHTELDKQIYMSIFQNIDHDKLHRIFHPDREFQHINDHWLGIKNARLWNDVAVSHVDTLVVPDLTAQIADDLMGARGVNFSLVTGFHENILYVSLRIRSNRRDAGLLIRKLVRRKGSAGGHGFMAGAQIDQIDSIEKAAEIAYGMQHKLVELIHPGSIESSEPCSIIS